MSAPPESLYQIDQGEGRVLAGLSFKAMGMKLGAGRADR